MKVRNPSVAGQPVCVGSRYVDTDADGVLDVEPAEAQRLATIPGFTLVATSSIPVRAPRVADQPGVPASAASTAPSGQPAADPPPAPTKKRPKPDAVT